MRSNSRVLSASDMTDYERATETQRHGGKRKAPRTHENTKKGSDLLFFSVPLCLCGSSALQMIDHAGDAAGAVAVVDIHHRHAVRAGVEHAEQGGEAAEAGAVSDAR